MRILGGVGFLLCVPCRPMAGLIPCAALTFCAAQASALVVELTPTLDTTLYEHAEGAIGNGAGEHFFSGMNSQGLRRRAALHFDIASALPQHAIVTAAELRLHVTRASGDADVLRLHALARSWGEGSSAAPGEGGQGAPATPGDATWLHAFYSDVLWSSPGGDFNVISDASALAADEGSDVFWSSAAMAQRVQSWLDDPSSNFGWLLIGSEDEPGVIRRFASRENDSPTARPALFIEYTVIPSAPAWVAAPLLALAAARRRRASTT